MLVQLRNKTRGIPQMLLDIGAVNFNPARPFVYTSGMVSPIYCDIRLVMSFPDERKTIMDQMNQLIAKVIDWKRIDVISGTATAGIPFASFLAQLQHKPMIYVRSSKKSHGLGNQIEGRIQEGDRVLIVEDIVSSGKSSLQNVECVRGSGAEVVGVAAVTSYEMDQARVAFLKQEVSLTYLTPMSQVVDEAVNRGMLSVAQKRIVIDWLENPTGWVKRHSKGSDA